MDTRCTSCGQRWPAFSMPSFDPRRDAFNVCAPCREQSEERARREAFTAWSDEPVVSPWVRRMQRGGGVAKVFS